MAKHKQKISRNSNIPAFTCPAVSVIIAMYNTEKYIGECLDSLLAQTFQDFEVIVVDDCSTDNSPAIVESYAPKFNGRLKIYKTKSNSCGGGYVPRNIGLNLSKGEYIFFADADDFVAKNALEMFFSTANQSRADVVYTGAYYSYNGNKNINLVFDKSNLSNHSKDIENKPTLTHDDPNKNLQSLLFNGEFHMPWAKCVRRDFLVENEITFPKIISGGDFIWTIQVMYYAKRLLRIPNAVYFYRDNNANSVTRKKRDPQDQISVCASAFLLGATALRDLSNKIPVLKQNPVYFRMALMAFFYSYLDRTFKDCMQISVQEVYNILWRNLVKENNSMDLVLSFLLSVIDEQQKKFMKTQQEFNQIMTQAQQQRNQIVTQANQQAQQFNQFAAQAKQRIAELEAEVRRLKSKE